ncbi:MAG: CRISPR-associated protein Cas4, partial [Verrucomicrobia bacterium]|nr:CRISPR-associated protein Cas4 [Verrucomicrobiota bacterium]
MDPLPLSLLNDFLYCPRRAALKAIEGCREENEHTILGDLAHEHADLPGYEVAKGVTLLRALPVWSERLGLSGKCDIVEVETGSARAPRAAEGASPSAFGTVDAGKVLGEAPNTARGARALPVKSMRPVEYKKGKRRQFENDDAQLCAQALCLEEMFGIAIERGAVFHAASKRRREVEFNSELRKLTEDAIHGLHALLEQSQIANRKSQIPTRFPGSGPASFMASLQG